VVVAGLILFICLGMLAFGLDFLVAVHDFGAGLPLLAAGGYGAWQVASTPFEVSIADGWLRTRGLRPAALRLADVERAEVAGSWRGARQRFLRRDGGVALEFDAGLFDQKRLAAGISEAGLGRRPGGRR
jgi:hypothetical protein